MNPSPPVSPLEDWLEQPTAEGSLDSAAALAQCRGMESAVQALLTQLRMGGASILQVQALASQAQALLAQVRWGEAPDEDSLDWPALRMGAGAAGSAQLSLQGEPSSEAYHVSLSESGGAASQWVFQPPQAASLTGLVSLSAHANRDGSWVLTALSDTGESEDWLLKPDGGVRDATTLDDLRQQGPEKLAEASEQVVHATQALAESGGSASAISGNPVGELMADSPEDAAQWGGDSILPGLTSVVLAGWRQAAALSRSQEKAPPAAEPAQEDPPPDPPAAGTGGEPKVPCTSCGKALSSTAKFCIHCGTPQTLRCPSCHEVIKPTAKFCTHCGCKI